MGARPPTLLPAIHPHRIAIDNLAIKCLAEIEVIISGADIRPVEVRASVSQRGSLTAVSLSNCILAKQGHIKVVIVSHTRTGARICLEIATDIIEIVVTS